VAEAGSRRDARAGEEVTAGTRVGESVLDLPDTKRKRGAGGDLIN
jgi:hypothetical protein